MLGLFLLSTATLAFEINLTRLFSVAQFYHFAFMVVSIALLGFGASGTLLAVFPGLGQNQPKRSLGWLALLSGVSMLDAYLLTNWLPFDSFSLAWDRRQVLILILHEVALALPFFFSGMAVSVLLTAAPQRAGQTYAVNLFGSALGCALALVAPAALCGEGTVVFSAGIAGLAAVICTSSLRGEALRRVSRLVSVFFLPMAVVLVLFSVVDFTLRVSGQAPLAFLDLHISPYKSLSYALQYPGAEVILRRWNAFSRVDLVRSPGVRSLPGLSYRYLQALPKEDGLLVDADELNPVVLPAENLDFADYILPAVAYLLRPEADVLVLEARGGLDVLAAQANGAQQITAVEVNPLIVSAASHIYHAPGTQVVVESGRSYLRRTDQRFDLLVFSLASSYHPVRSGAYTLSEDYIYTLEAFQDALSRLNSDGLLVVTRWLQTPPSESLRVFALATVALERSGDIPGEQIVALRGYNTATLLVKRSPFTPEELKTIRSFASERAFDLFYAPDLLPVEVNRYNVLPEPLYYQAVQELLKAQPRSDFYASYPFDASPPSDDHPFFSHYFKWSQAGQVWAELGKTWQPFGGAGYFVILALLGIAVLLAVGLILLPAVAFRWRARSPKPGSEPGSRPILLFLIYFALIGFAYLLVEIPLIQRFILYLGHPAYAMTAVLFTLLLFSGLGSQLGARIPVPLALAGLVLILLGAPLALPLLFGWTLGLSLGMRLVLTVLMLAPVGFLMGIPFPAGIRRLSSQRFDGFEQDVMSIPWVWGVNGAASVISAVLAALLALSFGFSWVLGLGAMCYAGAGLTVFALASREPARFPLR
jgi:hypothetical protein